MEPPPSPSRKLDLAHTLERILKLNRPKETRQASKLARHLTEEDLEKIGLSTTIEPEEEWQECHLLHCQDCLDRAELELGIVSELRMVLGQQEELDLQSYADRSLWGEPARYPGYLM